MKKNVNNRNFWGYSIIILLYVNYLLEIKSTYLSFKISELAIITILLFVLILIFNEINTNLNENFAERKIKYNQKFLFQPTANREIESEIIKNFVKIKQINKVEIKKVSNYKILLALI